MEGKTEAEKEAAYWTNRKEIHQLDEHVFISNWFQAKDQKKLLKMKIQYVLLCAGELEPCYPKDVKFKQLAIADEPKQHISHLFDDAYKFMDEAVNAGSNVLVHCAAGVSRSGSFAIMYLMRKTRRDYDTVLADVRKVRPMVSPNWGFESQLREWQKTLKLPTTQPDSSQSSSSDSSSEAPLPNAEDIDTEVDMT